MKYLNNKTIKAFTQDFLVGEPEAVEGARDEILRHMYADMRDAGYIPVLDLGVSQSIHRQAERNRYTVAVTVYGVFVGKEKSWKLEGVEVSNSGKVYPSASRATKINS